jgi:hypothetical protein
MRVHLKVIVKRNGKEIGIYAKDEDLLVWRGQMCLAYLLSQGQVGSITSSLKIVASSNSNAPNMNDDSGDPLNNEFNPLVGIPVDATYDLNPTEPVSSVYQNYAELMIKGTIISDGSHVLRKTGIIDSNSTPSQNIVLEDWIPDFNVILNDELDFIYTIRLG